MAFYVINQNRWALNSIDCFNRGALVYIIVEGTREDQRNLIARNRRLSVLKSLSPQVYGGYFPQPELNRHPKEIEHARPAGWHPRI